MNKIYIYLFLAAFAIGFSNPVSAQIINTIAGTGGAAGYDGDGPAISKKLNDPWGVAVDAAQNFYIADKDNAIIRKVTLAGVMKTIGGKAGITAFAGDEVAATNATFNTPYNVWVDAAGNVYVADGMNCRIRKIDPSGVVHTVAGYNLIGGYAGDGGPATAANLLYPTGVCVAPSGDMYIADYGNNVIRKVDAVTGNISTVAGNNTPGYSGDGGPATNAQLNNPYDVKVD
ncbi:MAG: hypothetical protein JWQ38_652, partial [Flavipsychrobacter sp.]|nr:hypothetical protein [Flavipsychrobacter sp.]